MFNIISLTVGGLGVGGCDLLERKYLSIAIHHTYRSVTPPRPLWTIMGSVDVCPHEAQQQLMVLVPEECMHRHAFPLCIGHLALFQCHRSIYISKGDDQEGPLCAPFLTPEMIWFISSSTEIYAFGGPSRLSHPQRVEMGEGAVKRETCDPPCDPRPNGPLSQCLIHVMRVTFSLLPGSTL